MTELFDHSFELDPFQLAATSAIDHGTNVLVSAPTGSGKTVVAEHAVSSALRDGSRCFYTAPIKALSNQKFHDLTKILGHESVGLLTGDHSINGDAPVLVMTTEVLRNMVYARSAALEGLGWVVLDEVHFLADAYRGPVWEEVLIHAPASVRFVCLSATVSNADELGEWITTLRGPTETIVEHRRPVELESFLLVGDRVEGRDHLVPLLVDGSPNRDGTRFDTGGGGPTGRYERQGRRPRSRFFTPRRIPVVERLSDEGLLPAIYFIFSRNGCDDAAMRCLDAGLCLTTTTEQDRIKEIAERVTAQLLTDDLVALGYDRWIASLENGVAAHHAGMIPSFREAVELCFTEGLIKVVFATETLALGINMPARSVVLEKLSKFNGETHEPLSAGLYTQLTGRAGRRGIDTHGDAVVLWSPFATFDQTAKLAASREFPLQSAFRPNYNMAANLIERYDHAHALGILKRSFAQFQVDRSVSRMVARQDELRSELEESIAHELDVDDADIFDVAGYAGLVEQIRSTRKARKRERFANERFLGELRPGDVLRLDGHPATNLAAVLSVTTRRGGAVRIRSVDSTGRAFQITYDSDWVDAAVVSRIDLPVPYLPKDRAFCDAAAKSLRRINHRNPRPRRGTAPLRRVSSESRATTEARIDELRTAIETHPLHEHPDKEQMLAKFESAQTIKRRLTQIDTEISGRGSTISDRFEAILTVLADTGHTDGWALTESGSRLRRIYHESDLLISLVLTEGLLDGLEPAELAAMVSTMTYEHRSGDPPAEPVIPTVELRVRYPRIIDVHRRLAKREDRARISPTREPQGGFMSAAWAWASGQELSIIVDEDLSGGDFVRNIRQLMDLLEQLGDVATSAATARSARQAVESLKRGVVLAGGEQN